MGEFAHRIQSYKQIAAFRAPILRGFFSRETREEIIVLLDFYPNLKASHFRALRLRWQRLSRARGREKVSISTRQSRKANPDGCRSRRTGDGIAIRAEQR
jgi:hypothetical protein